MDVGDWNSMKVHPDDLNAARMERDRDSGKREAWYVLSAEPEARIVAGVRSDVDITGIIDPPRWGNPRAWWSIPRLKRV